MVQWHPFGGRYRATRDRDDRCAAQALTGGYSTRALRSRQSASLPFDDYQTIADIPAVMMISRVQAWSSCDRLPSAHRARAYRMRGNGCREHPGRPRPRDDGLWLENRWSPLFRRRPRWQMCNARHRRRGSGVGAARVSKLACTASVCAELSPTVAVEMRCLVFGQVMGVGWTVTDTLLVGSFHRPSTMLDTA